MITDIFKDEEPTTEAIQRMLAEMYDELWRNADQWVLDHFDGDDLKYYLRTTD